MKVLYVSGYIDDTVVCSGALQSGCAFLQIGTFALAVTPLTWLSSGTATPGGGAQAEAPVPRCGLSV
jgi:hypothetical protein